MTAGACAAMGRAAGGRLIIRERALNDWEGAFSRMEGAAAHLTDGLPALLRRGDGGRVPALNALADRLEERPAALPEELTESLPFEDCLTPAERDTARECLLGLFAPTRDQQLRALGYAREQWAHFRQTSREKREKNGKLYVTLGWLAGAALFILMC